VKCKETNNLNLICFRNWTKAHRSIKKHSISGVNALNNVYDSMFHYVNLNFSIQPLQKNYETPAFVKPILVL
jgi:hypothetical protein